MHLRIKHSDIIVLSKTDPESKTQNVFMCLLNAMSRFRLPLEEQTKRCTLSDWMKCTLGVVVNPLAVFTTSVSNDKLTLYKDIQIPWSNVWLADKVLHFNNKRLSVAAQARVESQMSSRQQIEQQWQRGKREIPHCITTFLSKLYYLDHSLLHGCQRHQTKKPESVLIWLCLHPHLKTQTRLNGENGIGVPTNNEL